MSERRIIELLRALRDGWVRNMTDPTFEDRKEWVRGVIKGIDLSIWIVSKYLRKQ